MTQGRPLTEQAQPLRLRALLRKHNIANRELAARIPHARGKHAGEPIDDSTLSRLICQGIWPMLTDAEEVRARAETYLRERGVPEPEIATAWQFLDGRSAIPTNFSPAKADAAATAEDFELPEAEMLSSIAREHFKLAQHPFIDDVRGPSDVYLSKDQRYVRDSMYYASKHGGMMAVIGESGSGKSTLRRDLVDRLRTQNEPIVIVQPQTVDKTKLTAAHICDAIVADLSHESPKQTLEAKGRQVQRILRDSARSGSAHVLVIEEAHDLSIATLKYLKRFWELEDGYRKLIGIILIGQPELGEVLDLRRNYGLRELIQRCEVATLRPLNGNLEEYLALKFKRVNVALGDVFEANAFDAIRERLTRRRPGTNEAESHLYPLVVHNLVIKTMNLAPELGLSKIGAELVRRV
jgi:type II secretory pathway predicted ATPase ExeA